MGETELARVFVERYLGSLPREVRGLAEDLLATQASIYDLAKAIEELAAAVEDLRERVAALEDRLG